MGREPCVQRRVYYSRVFWVAPGLIGDESVGYDIAGLTKASQGREEILKVSVTVLSETGVKVGRGGGVIESWKGRRKSFT